MKSAAARVRVPMREHDEKPMRYRNKKRMQKSISAWASYTTLS